MKWLDELGELCKRHSLPLHMDGARLLNACAHLRLPAERVARDCDSVTLCFSKGLSAPAGAALAGSCHFIEQYVTSCVSMTLVICCKSLPTIL